MHRPAQSLSGMGFRKGGQGPRSGAPDAVWVRSNPEAGSGLHVFWKGGEAEGRNWGVWNVPSRGWRSWGGTYISGQKMNALPFGGLPGVMSEPFLPRAAHL